MPELVLASVVLVGIGILLAVRGRRPKAVRGRHEKAADTMLNPPWTIVSAGTTARIGPLIEQVGAIDDRVAQLRARLGSLVLADVSPGLAAPFYMRFGAELSRLASDHLPQAGAVAARFTALADAVAREMTTEPDRHREALVAVARRMCALRLQHSDLAAGWVQPYETVLERYEQERRQRAQHAERDLFGRLERMRRMLAADLEHLLGQAAPAFAVDGVTRELGGAIEHYRVALDALVAARPKAGPATTWRTRRTLTRWSADLTASPAALTGPSDLRALANLEIPAARGWPPSEQLSRAFRDAGGTLAAGADQAHAAHVRLVETCAHAVDQHVRLLIAAVSDDGRRRAQQADAACHTVLDAAEQVTTQVARSLLTPAATAPLLPVKAAAAVMRVDDHAGAALAAAVIDVVPSPGEPPSTSTETQHGNRSMELLVAMDRNATALAGIDGVIMAAMGAGAASPAMALCMSSLSGIPHELGTAFGDVQTYVHSPEFLPDVHHAVADLVNRVFTDALPQMPTISADGGIVHLAMQLHHAYSGLVHSLAGDLLAGEASGGELIQFVGKEALKTVGDLFGLAAEHSAAFQDAVSQLDLAGHAVEMVAGHAADAAGQLLASHIPFVTLVLSVSREMRRHDEHGTSVKQAVANVALDVGGIWAGVGAAAALGALFGMHPGIVLTVPGAIAGKVLTSAYKKRRYEKALAEFETARTEHDTTTASLLAAFESSVTGLLARGRDQCRGLTPAPTDDLGWADAGPAIGTLRDALATYRGQVAALLDDAAPTLDPPALHAAREVLQRTDVALAHSRTHHAHGNPRAALLALIDVDLPLDPHWRPAHELLQTTAATAATLRELADRRRAWHAGWLHQITTTMDGARQQIQTAARRELEALTAGRQAARDVLDQAAKAVLAVAPT